LAQGSSLLYGLWRNSSSHTPSSLEHTLSVSTPILTMQSFSRMPSNLLPAGSDDIVVVGRISLNTKKAKRNLHKIADHNARKVVDTFGYDQVYQEPAPSQTKSRFGYDHVHEADRQTKSRSRKPRGAKASDRALVVSSTQIVTPVTQTSRSVHLLLDLPDAVLAQLFMFADVAALGRLSTSCHTIHAVLGPQSEVWCALGAMQGLTLRASVPATAFRQALFGLEGNWVAAFSSFAASGEPHEVLHEADYLAGGLVATEKSHAPALVQIITAAAARCTADLDDAAARVLATLRKIEARPEVFAVKSQRAVREAHLDLRERAVLERLAQDDAPTFDYFHQEEVEEFEWEEEPGVKAVDLDPADARELAASFLEVMGLRHGHPEETQAAIRAIQA